RRRWNIHWRELFKSRCRNDKVFTFQEQLNYRRTCNGFEGVSPLISFSRRFAVDGNCIRIEDRIFFKASMHFSSFYPVNVGLFLDGIEENEENSKLFFVYSRFDLNSKRRAETASGIFTLFSERNDSVAYEPGDEITRSYAYEIL
ncbi:MAG: hypothetical protein KDD53_13200, partial [Bdellovibrionales bacterium]|nr:hypothetical protein [Bdellovibrionales bacterium]